MYELTREEKIGVCKQLQCLILNEDQMAFADRKKALKFLFEEEEHNLSLLKYEKEANACKNTATENAQ